ncbi:MAG TPA: DUF4920 domain-containing protein [Chitinophagaceae bacterium]|nr:DUF4920 domain-containing protein [Chitinophagaceae bacterium]
MRTFAFLLWSSIVFASCQNTATDTEKKNSETKTEAVAAPQYFGEKITEEGAIPTDSLKARMGENKKMDCKLTGTIDAVCQKKGCWMELKNHDGSTIRVTFKDYGFFMPKDASGKTAIVDGFASVEETSVDELKEFAKDDGQSKEEIAAITEPKKELVFEAKGVIIK